MVRHYVRKTDRQKWSPNNMENAVLAVISGTMGYKKAAQRFSVPSSTLERYVKKKRENADYKIDKSTGKFHSVFTAAQEIELCTYINHMQQHLFGVTTKELRAFAYQLAEKHGCRHNFNNATKLAGQDWAKNFIGRHPDVLSLSSAMAFDRVAILQFFGLLTRIINEHDLAPDRIYNCAEIVISIGAEQASQIVPVKIQTDQIITTAIVCFSPSGNYTPPMLVLPAQTLDERFAAGLPPGGWTEITDNGRATVDILHKWLTKLVKFTGATKEQPVLLLLDGYTFRLKDLQLIDLAQNNGVILLCYPVQFSHRLQRPDVAFTELLSVHYDAEVMKSSAGNIGLLEIGALFGRAFLSAANRKILVDVFEEAGIWPVKPASFTDFSTAFGHDDELTACVYCDEVHE